MKKDYALPLYVHIAVADEVGTHYNHIICVCMYIYIIFFFLDNIIIFNTVNDYIYIYIYIIIATCTVYTIHDVSMHNSIPFCLIFSLPIGLPLFAF